VLKSDLGETVLEPRGLGLELRLGVSATGPSALLHQVKKLYS
jgi:hypothetical protein